MRKDDQVEGELQKEHINITSEHIGTVVQSVAAYCTIG